MAEFSALFGKDRRWGYRQIDADNVTPILGFGKMIIPVQEINRILRIQMTDSNTSQIPVIPRRVR